MLDFRILFGAVMFAVAFMAVVLFSFDERDVSIATLPRPTVETAAAPRVEPIASPSKATVIPRPIFASGEITGSIDPAAKSPKEVASPPRPRVARKKDSEEKFVNPFELFFQLLGEAKLK